MRVVVTGGTGFIGGEVVTELRRRGHDAVAASRHGDVRVDVNDRASLREGFAGADAVVNAVQFTNYPVENPRRGLTFERIDRDGTLAQVTAAREVGVPRFAYVSGAGAEPGAAKHWYRAKAAAEEGIRTAGFEQHFILRPSWVYGRKDQSLNRFVPLARFSPVMPVIGSGRQALEPVFVGDVAWAVGEALDRGVSGTFEIGGPERLSMDDVERALLRALGKRRPLVHMPAGALRVVGKVAQRLPRPPLSADAVEFLVSDALGDTGPLEEALPGLPRTKIDAGLASYLSG